MCREGGFGERFCPSVFLSLSFSLCLSLSGKQAWHFVWSSDNFFPSKCFRTMQVQYSTFLQYPHKSTFLFLLPESELKTQPTSGAWDYVASGVSFPSSYQHCCFPDVYPFTACQGCGCKFGSLQMSHEVKMTRKLQHWPLHKNQNLDHPLIFPLKVLMKRIALQPEPHSILGSNSWIVFLRPLGNVRRFLLKWTLSNKL